MTDFLNPNHDTSNPPTAGSPSANLAPGGDLRHDRLPKPLEEAADVLSSVAAEPSEPLSDSVKAR